MFVWVVYSELFILLYRHHEPDQNVLGKVCFAVKVTARAYISNYGSFSYILRAADSFPAKPSLIIYPLKTECLGKRLFKVTVIITMVCTHWGHHCYNTNFTLIHSLNPFCSKCEQKIALQIHTIYFVHISILCFNVSKCSASIQIPHIQTILTKHIEVAALGHKILTVSCKATCYLCEQVLFVYIFTIIPPRLTDHSNFITVLIVNRELEQMTLLF